MSRKRRDAFVEGWLYARDYYGVTETDTGAEHGAECQKTESTAYFCTCDELAQHMHALLAWRERT